MITLYRSYTHTMHGIADGFYPISILTDPSCRFYFGCSRDLVLDPEVALRDNFFNTKVGVPLQQIVETFAASLKGNNAGLAERTRCAKDVRRFVNTDVSVIEELVGWPIGTFAQHLKGSRVSPEDASHNYPALEEAVEIVNASGIDPQVKVVWRR